MISIGSTAPANKPPIRHSHGVGWRPFGWFAVALFACRTALAYAAGPAGSMVPPAGAVLLSPGMDLQREVTAQPPGTIFFLAAGLYRTQQILPKDGDRFIGAAGAVLNGARLLTGVQRLNNLFVFVDQAPVPDAWRHGECKAGYPRCDHPQALFLDDLPLRAVGRLADVAPGTWYYDYDLNRIYLAEDPTGRKAEITYRPFAFGGAARDVRIENLVVEKYASANQRGAINNQGEGKTWTIRHNEVRWNYGYGMTLAAGHRASDNFVHHNGQLGIGGGNSTGILVERNEIAPGNAAVRNGER